MPEHRRGHGPVPAPDPPTPIDLGGRLRLHIVGIAGTGMAPLAIVALAMGHPVTGTDAADSPRLGELRRLGAAVAVGHDPGAAAAADVVVASSAVPEDDPELVAARRGGVPVRWRSELLAAMCATRRTLAVSGTKGKTTTTAMLARVLEGAGWSPSFVVGGDLHGLGHGAGWGGGDWMVVEADESDGTFVTLPHEVAVVTNVLADHVAFYGGMDGLRRAFARFVAEATGPCVLGADDEGAATLAAAAAGPVVTFGSSPHADVRFGHPRPHRFGIAFDVCAQGEPLGALELAVPGAHNARNAAAALAAGLAVGVQFDAARAALATFREVARRFERRGERDGVTFVDDYAHLPAALEVVLATARDGGWGRVVAVFQPHRYSRTEALHGAFADAFVDADVVVLTDVYPAGEEPRAGVTGRLIADAVTAAHPGADVRYVADRASLPAVVAGILRPGDLCLTLGAGDLDRLAGDLVAGRVP